ncbi:MAG: glycosyl hydrolase [Planctomycetota bacterium]|nr:MAG: glycosyl hydrolase [Planctomycetota bacterium]
MVLQVDFELTAEALRPAMDRMWNLSAGKLRAMAQRIRFDDGVPVFTENGRYRPQPWTDWTGGFYIGSLLLQFDATDDEAFWHAGREAALRYGPEAVTHFGVHDHGFNTVSSFGNLLRLVNEGRVSVSAAERDLYEFAVKCSASVQAMRWTTTADGMGFIHSFNGPHSLFIDTLRTLRVLALAYRLGHTPHGENDDPICLLERLVQHATVTARYNVFYGEGRDIYDEPGRVAHESIFNVRDGRYRCPSTQQGFSPFSTWTRGLAWAILGFAELLEFLSRVPDDELDGLGGRREIEGRLRRAADVVCNYYLENTPTDGIPYWDTAAPGLVQLGAYLDRPADPFNEFEPVDSSAAAIAAQGLMRFGVWLREYSANDEPTEAGQGGRLFFQAGLTILGRLLQEPYLSTSPDHEGLLLHALYHRPRGWDHVPEGHEIPHGEATMWGDYHLREACVYVARLDGSRPYCTFFSGIGGQQETV